MTAPRHNDYYATTAAGRSRTGRSPQTTSDFGHGSNLGSFDHAPTNSYSHHNYTQPRSSVDRPVYPPSGFTGQYSYAPTSSAVELMYSHQYEPHVQPNTYYDRRDGHSQPYPGAYPNSGPVYAAPVASYPQGTDYMQYPTPDPYAHPSSAYEPHVQSQYPPHGATSQRGTSARPDTSQVPRRRTTSTAQSYSAAVNELVEDSAVIKKKRRKADAAQLKVLNEVWERTAFPSTEERAELARKLEMSPRSVQIWFQNRRQSMRQSMRQSGTVTPGSHQSFGQIESPTEDFQIAGFNGYTSSSVSHTTHPTSSSHRETAPARSSTSPSSSSHRSASSRR